MAKKYVIALDQGTTSSRAIVYDKNANPLGSKQREFTQYYPQNRKYLFRGNRYRQRRKLVLADRKENDIYQLGNITT